MGALWAKGARQTDAPGSVGSASQHQLLWPIFEVNISASSHGFRPRRILRRAVRASQWNVVEGRRAVVGMDPGNSLTASAKISGLQNNRSRARQCVS